MGPEVYPPPAESLDLLHQEGYRIAELGHVPTTCIWLVSLLCYEDGSRRTWEVMHNIDIAEN